MNDKENSEEAKLREVLYGFPIAMFTSIDNGKMRARPVTPFMEDGGLIIRFLMHQNADAAGGIEDGSRGCLTFTSAGSNDYVSVSGTVTATHDRKAIGALWGPYADMWFDGGPDIAEVAALSMEVEAAEHWDGTLNLIRNRWEIA